MSKIFVISAICAVLVFATDYWAVYRYIANPTAGNSFPPQSAWLIALPLSVVVFVIVFLFGLGLQHFGFGLKAQLVAALLVVLLFLSFMRLWQKPVKNGYIYIDTWTKIQVESGTIMID